MKRRSFLLQTAAFLAGVRRSAFARLASTEEFAPLPRGNLSLWYDKAASGWDEALPIGSGRFGAMVFGGVREERLQLNEDTLCSEEPRTSDLSLDVTKQYDAVVKLLQNGQYAEAGDIITKNWTGRSWPCYQPLADLFITFAATDRAAENYRRELNLAEAISRASYSIAGVTYTREYFASHPDQVIACRLLASKPGALSFAVRLTSPHPTAKIRRNDASAMVLAGQAPGLVIRRTMEWIEERGEQWKYPEIWDEQGQRRPNAKTVLYGEEVGGRGMFFEAHLQLRLKGGKTTRGNNQIQVEGATEATLLLSAATSYNGFELSPSLNGADPSRRAAAYLSSVSAMSYRTLRLRHIKDHRRLFDRVSIEIGHEGEPSKLPTDERIARFDTGDDPALAVLYVQFARYLTIAASRPGSQPLNLQGMWSDKVIPPWACGYTTNINFEMNYWGVDLLNLSECFEPLERFMHEISVTGSQVARTMYKRRGAVLHHNTTIWRGAQPVDNNAGPAFWNLGAGWLVKHLWDHYEFTGDRAFLERSYPVMKLAAEFLSDWLVEDKNGYLVTPAGVSPENTFYYTDPSGARKKGNVCMGPTMDIAITRQAFQNCLDAAAVLGKDEPLLHELRARLAKLLPYQIGQRGQLQEWPFDFEEVEPHHRHVSHLYGLYPDWQINEGTPELFSAAQRSLEMRGDEGTGWSRAWKICLWARLHNGNHAYKLVKNLFKPALGQNADTGKGGLLPNMFCSCPPMQIDGNFGGAAGIVEMLLQSHDGVIHLLPALPDHWQQGRVKGLLARGGFEVVLEWSKGKLEWAEISSRAGGRCTVRYASHSTELSISPGGSHRFTGTI